MVQIDDMFSGIEESPVTGTWVILFTISGNEVSAQVGGWEPIMVNRVLMVVNVIIGRCCLSSSSKFLEAASWKIRTPLTF